MQVNRTVSKAKLKHEKEAERNAENAEPPTTMPPPPPVGRPKTPTSNTGSFKQFKKDPQKKISKANLANSSSLPVVGPIISGSSGGAAAPTGSILQKGSTLTLKRYNKQENYWRVDLNGGKLKAKVFIEIQFDKGSPSNSTTPRSMSSSNNIPAGCTVSDLYRLTLSPFLNEIPVEMSLKKNSNQPKVINDNTKRILTEEIDSLRSEIHELQSEAELFTKIFKQEFMMDLPCIRQPQPTDLMWAKFLENPFQRVLASKAFIHETLPKPETVFSAEVTPPTPRDDIPKEGSKESLQSDNPKTSKELIIKDFASDEEYDEEKNTKQSTNDFEIALSPVRPFKFIELLNTTLNPGSVPMNVIEELNSLNFDIFPYKDSNDEEFLILLLMQMFHKTGVMHEFNIPESTLYRFIKTVAMRYRSVPYHNFFHAWNVCQTMYFFLQSCGAGNFFNSYEVLALLIAALCHDCDHPGLNNTFQVKASTRVSILHKKSILENHHLFHCYNILSQPECNILQNMKHTDRKAVEWRISKLILATDLAFHGFIHDKLVEKKKTFVKFTKLNETKTVDDISQTEEEDRILLLCCLIKGGDLSNEIRPTNIAQRWAKLVIKEFFEQSKTERSLDLAVTPFMDPQKVILSKEQINFIEGLCLPLYEPLSTIFPPMALCVKQLLTNKAEWNNRLLNFFSNDMASIKKLPNTSIWERDQEGKKWNKKNLLSLLNQTKEK